MKAGVLASPIARCSAVIAVALVACTPPHPHSRARAALRTIARLDCPAAQGDLRLQSAAGDGRSCSYAGPAGASVSLQLIELTGGDASGALAPLTADLRSELPSASSHGAGADKDRVDIDLPGVHIHANDGGTSRDADTTAGSAVPVGQGAASPPVAVGKSVEIDEGGSVRIGNATTGQAAKGVVIDANENGAEIHVTNGAGGNRMTFILASDTPGPHGYRLVGYEARGPLAGPLAVVSIRSPNNEHEGLRREMGELLRRNVGG